MADRFWLLLEKSDGTRISKGIDGYRDITGEAYHYDSLVPNHLQLAAGDCIVLRREDEILGIGRVTDIARSAGTKIHRRCPHCQSTDIRERTTRSPRWKCGRCAHEFSDPRETVAGVISYVASIGDFAPLNSPPSVADVKRCATAVDGVAAQHSILPLDSARVRTLLEGRAPVIAARSASTGHSGQGFGLSPPEIKVVELRAMQLARELYERDGWEVSDMSANNPYDLLAVRGQMRRFIEVKGTVGAGDAIALTHGEVRHVGRNAGACALVVVAGIELDRTDGAPRAGGGVIAVHLDPWSIDPPRLEPTEYRYALRGEVRTG